MVTLQQIEDANNTIYRLNQIFVEIIREKMI